MLYCNFNCKGEKTMGEIVKLVSSSDSIANYVGDTIKVGVTKLSDGTAEVVVWERRNGTLHAFTENITVSKYIKARNILPLWLQKTSCELVKGIAMDSPVKRQAQSVQWVKQKKHKGADPAAVYCRYHKDMRI